MIKKTVIKINKKHQFKILQNSKIINIVTNFFYKILKICKNIIKKI